MRLLSAQVCKLVAIALAVGMDKEAITAVAHRYQHQENYQIPISGGGKNCRLVILKISKPNLHTSFI
jgi:hypothetical protein